MAQTIYRGLLKPPSYAWKYFHALHHQKRHEELRKDVQLSNSIAWFEFSLLDQGDLNGKKKEKKTKNKVGIQKPNSCMGRMSKDKVHIHELDDKVGVPLFQGGSFFFLFSCYYIGGKLAVCLHPRSKSWREDTSRSFSRRTESRREGPNELVTICLKICQGAGFCFFSFLWTDIIKSSTCTKISKRFDKTAIL